MQTPVEEYPLSKVQIADLKLDESNPNKPTKEQIAAIRKSFERFGFLVPIIVNERMEIGDGEHRALIYKAMGLQEIPAYIVPRINDDIERRLLRQTMNKLRGEHDIKLDADEIALIFKNDKLDHLAELIAQQRESLENILTKHKGIQFQHEDGFDVDKALEDLVPETQLGDIWQLGQHRIICADCSDERSIQRLMEDKKADMVFTDPPYNIGYKSGTWSKERKEKMGTIENDDMPEPDYIEFLETSLNTIKNSIEPESDQYICTDWKAFHLLREAILNTKQKISNLIVWNKEYQTQALNKYANAHEFILFIGDNGGPYKDINVWNCPRVFDADHPTPKPIEIISKAILSSQGNIIFDPFLGSGSTLIACEQTNRICYGVEIDPHYVDVCCKRYEAYTHNKAIKVPRGE